MGSFDKTEVCKLVGNFYCPNYLIEYERKNLLYTVMMD